MAFSSPFNAAASGVESDALFASAVQQHVCMTGREKNEDS